MMAKEFGKWPHEIAHRKNDLPGAKIPMSDFIWDVQCLQAYNAEIAKQRKKAQREAEIASKKG